MIKKMKNKSTEHMVGKHLKIHGGKIMAVVYEAVSSFAVTIDYDGYFDPDDKKTRITGRKIVTVDELRKPDLISVGQFKHLLSGSYSY
jgi:hypothetical protein